METLAEKLRDELRIMTDDHHADLAYYFKAMSAPEPDTS